MSTVSGERSLFVVDIIQLKDEKSFGSLHHVVSAASISSFKRRLSSFVVNVEFEHFSVN